MELGTEHRNCTCKVGTCKVDIPGTHLQFHYPEIASVSNFKLLKIFDTYTCICKKLTILGKFVWGMLLPFFSI